MKEKLTSIKRSERLSIYQSIKKYLGPISEEPTTLSGWKMLFAIHNFCFILIAVIMSIPFAFIASSKVLPGFSRAGEPFNFFQELGFSQLDSSSAHGLLTHYSELMLDNNFLLLLFFAIAFFLLCGIYAYSSAEIWCTSKEAVTAEDYMRTKWTFGMYLLVLIVFSFLIFSLVHMTIYLDLDSLEKLEKVSFYRSMFLSSLLLFLPITYSLTLNNLRETNRWNLFDNQPFQVRFTLSHFLCVIFMIALVCFALRSFQPTLRNINNYQSYQLFDFGNANLDAIGNELSWDLSKHRDTDWEVIDNVIQHNIEADSLLIKVGHEIVSFVTIPVDSNNRTDLHLFKRTMNISGDYQHKDLAYWSSQKYIVPSSLSELERTPEGMTLLDCAVKHKQLSSSYLKRNNGSYTWALNSFWIEQSHDGWIKHEDSEKLYF